MLEKPPFGEGAYLPGMVHAVNCQCERCKEAHVNGWYDSQKNSDNGVKNDSAN
jgi:hypothetical protein